LRRPWSGARKPAAHRRGGRVLRRSDQDVRQLRARLAAEGPDAVVRPALWRGPSGARDVLAAAARRSHVRHDSKDARRTAMSGRPFRVLGIESSCDETAASVVDDGRVVRSDVVASQNEVHARYGGVVPELASRAHILNVVPVVQAALDRASCTLGDIDGIAVTNAPGLVGALLVGLQTAKALAWATGKPLVGVHHLEGHLTAIYLEPA